MKQIGFRNLGFAWAVRAGPKGLIIDLPIFGFEDLHPCRKAAASREGLGAPPLQVVKGWGPRRTKS